VARHHIIYFRGMLHNPSYFFFAVRAVIPTSDEGTRRDMSVFHAALLSFNLAKVIPAKAGISFSLPASIRNFYFTMIFEV
jgi:hypothetical protein